VLLTLSGNSAATDANTDNDDIKEDIAMLGQSGKQAVPWGWYQEGLNDDGTGLYPAYVSHHDVPQYFGYIRQGPLWQHVHDIGDVFPAIQNGTLGDRSVTIVKGGYKNPFGWLPANPDAKVRAAFAGDDDHPGYSDSQLSESLVAKVVNTIARSRYWNDSVIILVWDDSEGFYDHVPPPQFEPCPDGRACGDGPRVPLILISPFARSHAIVSDPGDHAAFPKFLSTLFDLPLLSSLPDEAAHEPEGPRDGNPAITDLLGGFDPQRLSGRSRPIAAADAQIPDDIVDRFPAKMSCTTLGITPVHVPEGLDAPPPGYAPRLLPAK
jgi:phospholipase C